MRLIRLRKKFYRELEPTAWPGRGLSPVNIALVGLVVIAVAEAILSTEPTISGGRELMLSWIELGLGIVFLIEYLARLWVAVDNPRYTNRRFPRLSYALSPIAIVDLVAILPALFAFGGASSLFLRFFRVLRMLRLAKLGRTSRAWVMIREVVVEKRHEFLLVLGMLLITILVAGSLLYWAEGEAQPEKFGSIPRAMWWAIVTLTTVGYGDAYPITPLGQILAGFIAVAGIMLIAIPTGLFAASFTETMEKHRLAEEEEQAQREIELAKAKKIAEARARRAAARKNKA